MKRIFKFCAIFGNFFTSGLVSCSDDDDNACCSSTYVYDGIIYSYTYCPDGTYSYSIDGQELPAELDRLGYLGRNSGGLLQLKK